MKLATPQHFFIQKKPPLTFILSQINPASNFHPHSDTTQFAISNQQTTGKGKGLPRTGHEGPEGGG